MIFRRIPKRYDDVESLEDDDLICWCLEVDKGTILAAIGQGAHSLEQIRKRTNACTGSDCADRNPNRRCCSREIRALLRKEEA